MPITFDQISPILAASYSDDKAAWRAIAEVAVPRLWRRTLGVSPRDFATEVLSDLGRHIIEKRGRREPPPPPPADYTAWLRTVILNFTRDVLRKHEREQAKLQPEAFDEARHLTAGAEPVRSILPGLLDALAAHSPLYVIGLHAWMSPEEIDRPLLEAASQVPTRGHTGTTTGLARSVDETLGLLGAHRDAFAAGASRNAAACERLGWILRSDTDDFEAWRRDRRAVTSARETLSKWFQRARTKLRELAASREAAPARLGAPGSEEDT